MESPDVPWAKREDGRVKKRLDEKPSRAAVFFLEFLESKGVRRGRLIDLGCGAGRNAVFFAEAGFEVHAVDRSEDVLKDIDLHGVMPHCHSVTDYWLFEDDFFDFALDIFCFCEQEDSGRRAFYLAEMLRVLKQGGYLLLSVPSDAFQKETVGAMFEGFEILASEEAEDRIHGKSRKALNLILRKK
ncbi:class I SAM-dependent methyltransferase [Candidatus Micrarchaeota archaeon]|nr:class I SAM-dependent methyltransferase [Candidatus Micrarchaeota archaeon]